MRTTLTLLASISLLSASAQVDINKMMQERMSRQGQVDGKGGDGNTAIVDDAGPFVPNEFIGSFRMEMHHYKDGAELKTSPSNMRYASSTDWTSMKNETSGQHRERDMRMITDLKGKWSYMLTTDDKGKKTAMKSHKKQMALTADAATKKEPTVTITTETRTIEGHVCTKVIVASEDGTWTGWVAKGLKGPFADILRSMAQRGNDSHMRAMKGLDGMPLEFEWAPSDGKSRMVCYIKELVSGKVDASVFSLEGYEVMEMPGFGQ